MISLACRKADDLRTHPASQGMEPSHRGIRTNIDVMDRPDAAPNQHCDLNHARLCDGMTAAQVQELERIARIQEVKKRRPLYLPGDSSHNVYLLTQGRIILTNIGAGGNVVTVEILEPGDLFGEFEAMERAPRDTAAEALDHAVVCVFAWEDFRQYLAKHPNIGLKLAHMIGWRLRRTHSRIEDLVCRDVAARLAHLLLELSQCEAARGVRTTLTHQEIADLISCSRETVSNVLGRFRNQGLIRFNGTLTILDEKGLSHFRDHDGPTHFRWRDHREEQPQPAVQSARGRYRDGRKEIRGAESALGMKY